MGMLTLILLRGTRANLVRQYPSFYLYISFVLVTDLGRLSIALLLGVETLWYYYAYHLPNIFFPIFQILVFRDIYLRVVGNSKNYGHKVKWLVMVIALMTAPVVWEVTTWEGVAFFYSYQVAALFLQVSFCLILCVEIVGREDLILGQNTRGMLIGLGILVTLQLINFADRFIEGALTAEWFGFLTQFVYFAALLIFTFGLWDFAPDTHVEASDLELASQIDGRMRETIRILSDSGQG